MAAKFCTQNVYKIFSKYGVHFVYINSDLQKMYTLKAVYAIFIQNSYKIHTNNYMQNACHISTYFDLFVVHFLGNHCTQFKLETLWLSTWR